MLELTPDERLTALERRPEKTAMLVMADPDTGARRVLYMRRQGDTLHHVGTLELTPAVLSC